MIARPASLALLLVHFTRVWAERSLSMALTGPSEVTDVDNFSVVSTISNTGDEELKLYKDPHSVIDDFPEDTFTFTTPDDDDDALPPHFIGAKVKYMLEAATEFVTLQPGENVTVAHKLGSAYNFTAAGTYEIDAARKFFYYDSETQGPKPIYATLSSTHSAKLSGTLESTIVAKRKSMHTKMLAERDLEHGGSTLEKRATFSGCSASKQTSIKTALTTTNSYVAKAISYLDGLSSGKARYTHWFGTYSSSRKTTVLNHYKKIKTSNPSSYKYICSCTRDVYAYVYPDTPGVVYLCNTFWTAPTSGTDSKAGTIVHEASHFTINGGTSDHAYGQSAANSLAVSSPSKAIFNADSHEYFAENTPALA